MKVIALTAIFALAVLGFFADVIFGPHILLDTNPYLYDPWQTYATEADLESRTYWPDPFLTYLPRYAEVAQAFESGRFPLWNPYIFGGAPFLADPQTRVAYPISAVLAAVAPAKAMGYDVAIHTFIAMLGMFLFLRSVGARATGAMIGGFAYAFSSFFYVRMGHPTFIAAGAWIPFFFYAFELARRREHIGTIALVIFFSLGYLAGFPQVLLLGVGSVLIYGFYVGMSEPGSTRKNVGRVARIFAISGGLSLLVVSVQLVPFIEFLRHSIGLSIEFDHMRDVFLAPTAVLLRSLFPHVLGNPVEGTDWSDLIRDTIHHYNPEFAVYCGAGTLILAIGSLLFIRRSARLRILLALLVLSVGAAINPVLLRIAYTVLPFFRASRVSRVAVIACFALSAMAGIGFSMISAERSRHVTKRLACVVAVALAAVLIASIIFEVRGEAMLEGLAHKARTLPGEMWTRIHAYTRSGKIREWADGRLPAWFQYEKRQISLGALFTAVASALILLHGWPRLGRGRLAAGVGAAFVVFVALDVGITARAYLVTQPAGSIAETPGIRLLRDRLGAPGRWRTWSLSYENEEVRALPPNTNHIYGISSLAGAGTIVPRAYVDLFEESKAGRLPSRLLGLRTPLSGEAVYLADLAGVRYAIAGRARAPFVAAPVLRPIAGTREPSCHLRMTALGGDMRLAVCQQQGNPAQIVIDTPPVRALDFSVGFPSGQAESCDSVVFLLTYEGLEGKVDFRQAFDLREGADRWHPFRIDISRVSGGKNSVWIGAIVPGAAQSQGVTVAWSELDLVYGDCDWTKHLKGYEVAIPQGAGFAKLTLTSEARELPLEVIYGPQHKQMLWVAFASPGKRRPIVVDLRQAESETILLRSASAFDLEEVKTVFLGESYPYWQLIHDEDMYIYENHAVFAKGICVQQRKVGSIDSGDERMLELASLGAIEDLECGTCAVVSYEPERIELAASTSEACYLIFQDTMYPGWKAYVDGKPADLLKNDLAIRAVALTAGEHSIVMEFKSGSFRLGLVMTCAGIALTLLYATALRRRQDPA